MAKRKPYNPNTAYGRKKLREEAKENYNNLPQNEKNDFDAIKLLIILIVIVIVFLYIYLTGDSKSVGKWLTR